MRFSTKCWSEHILSAYKTTKNLKHPLYMTFKVWFYTNILMIYYMYLAPG